jgi:hypothetical protein
MRRVNAASVALLTLMLARWDGAVAGSYTCTEASHNWIGGWGSDWFSESNWDPLCFGGSPTDHPFPVHFGPLAHYINGIFDHHQVPLGPATLSEDYDFSPRLTMRAWDGPSVLTITNGATYTTSAEIGGLPNPVQVYEPSGPIQPVTLNLDGGFTAGHWTFLEHSQLNLSGGVVYDADGWHGRFGGLRISANTGLQIRNSDAPLLPGVVQNSGFIQLAEARPGIPPTYLKIDGTVVLRGGGEIILDADNTRIASNPYGLPDDLLINEDNIIRGRGTITVPLENRHVIRAEGGLLNFANAWVQFDPADGEIQVASDGVVWFGRSEHSIGKVHLVDGSRIGGWLRDLNLVGPSALVVDGQELNLSGTIRNPVAIRLEAEHSSSAHIFIDGPTEFRGGGEIVLKRSSTSNNAGFHARGAYLAGDQLINVDNVIRGAGYINVALVNQHILRAEGGRLEIMWADDSVFDMSDGETQVASDGELFYHGDTAAIGKLRLEAGAKIATGSWLRGLELVGDAPLVIRDQVLTLSGEIRNPVAIRLDEGVFSAGDYMYIDGAAELRGGGELVLATTNGGVSARWNHEPNDLLVNVDNIIRGYGKVSLPIRNSHLIRAEGGALYLNQGVTGSGDVEVADGASLHVNGELMAGSFTLADGAHFEWRGERLSVANWIGDLPADTFRPPWGTPSRFAAGETPGRWAVNGSATFNDRWTIDLRLAGEDEYSDRLIVSNDVALGSATITVSLVDGFCPEPGNIFPIINVGGTLSGTFAGLPEGTSIGTLCDTEFFISYQGCDGNDVVLWSAVPDCEGCRPTWAGWRDTDGDGAGDVCDVTHALCDNDAVTIDATSFTPGAREIASAHSITAQGAVRLPPGANLRLQAPSISLRPGFRVAAGATLRLSTGPHSCTTVASEPLSLATGAAPAAASAAESLPAVAGPLHLASTDQLPDDTAALLARYGLDLDAMANLLLGADGTWLLFETSQGILPGDGNGTQDVYRLDLMTETLTLLSRNSTGSAGNGASRYPAADATGELVVFQSTAADLVAGDNNEHSDIFLHDVALGETSLVTLMDAGAAAHPAIDSSGQEVLYDQRGDSGRRSIHLHRLWDTEPAETLSLPENGTGVPLDNHHPAISVDGRYVAYLETSAADAEPGCSVYLYDRSTGWFDRAPCPLPVAADPEAAKPAFNADATLVQWFLPGLNELVILPNPLHDAPTGAAE